MVTFSEKLKKVFILIAGPLGCYATYHYLFILRYLDHSKYPLLTDMYGGISLIVDVSCAIIIAIISSLFLSKQKMLDNFKPRGPRLSIYILILINIGILILLLANTYRIIGSISPNYIIKYYQTLSYSSTKGGAWMVLSMYCAIFIQLINMYVSGVSKTNIAFLLISLVIASLSGGRGIIILFAMTFLIMMMFERVKLTGFIAASLITAASMALSYVIVTDLRAPDSSKILFSKTNNEELKNSEKEYTISENKNILQADSQKQKSSGDAELEQITPSVPVSPTDSFEDLNYNAAFITEDVLRGFSSGKLTAKMYFAEDAATIFVPRSILPEKPTSTSETREVYPDIASRGTNITFPLKANIIMHMGSGAFYLDWLIVAAFQIIMIIGIARRNISPDLLGFSMMFCGLGFMLIARGGIFNARILVIAACILLSYLGYISAIKIQEKVYYLFRKKY
nr:hypothetical protein [Pseudomonas aeruginosa]EIU2668731.1 hypothetical protein [Pseudomonas aeruginosa]EIU2857409.1 hypothetical protein [Pseudomonas aeruginosa]EIU2877510.1 hypothetical protein [Pseudomonas aeruginosa]